ncbi:MAG: hypothetical protein JWO63_1215 [Frankiales bacterium]|nr:hypothetical protein [Frankiales bacterium]
MTGSDEAFAGATQREQLDRCLTRFVDAVLTGDDTAARQAFVDAQALPALTDARTPALVWVETERIAAQALPDDLETETAAATRLLSRGRP